MLYPDPALTIDALLDEVASSREADVTVEDEDRATHRLWRISDPERIAAIQTAMANKKLLIADGHHRYETALAFGRENPNLPGADRVMMTFVNMHSPGLKILATHRLVHGLQNFDAKALLQSLPGRKLASLDELRAIFSRPAADLVRIGIAAQGVDGLYLFERKREPGELDVHVLHDEILKNRLGIDDTAVREEKNIHYVRGLEAAMASFESGNVQAALLLEPTTMQQVADVAFSGGVMPQKSTDFYPKLLSGLTIYKLS